MTDVNGGVDEADPDFSRRARAAITAAVTRYADTLELLAKQCAGADETALERDVRDALSRLGGTETSILIDYMKRIAFALFGSTITILIQIFTNPNPPSDTQLLIFVIVLSLTAILTTVCILADFPGLRRLLLPRN
jgi:hypothetical protein